MWLFAGSDHILSWLPLILCGRFVDLDEMAATSHHFYTLFLGPHFHLASYGLFAPLYLNTLSVWCILIKISLDNAIYNIYASGMGNQRMLNTDEHGIWVIASHLSRLDFRMNTTGESTNFVWEVNYLWNSSVTYLNRQFKILSSKWISSIIYTINIKTTSESTTEKILYLRQP